MADKQVDTMNYDPDIPVIRCRCCDALLTSLALPCYGCTESGCEFAGVPAREIPE